MAAPTVQTIAVAARTTSTTERREPPSAGAIGAIFRAWAGGRVAAAGAPVGAVWSLTVGAPLSEDGTVWSLTVGAEVPGGGGAAIFTVGAPPAEVGPAKGTPAAEGALGAVGGSGKTLEPGFGAMDGGGICAVSRAFVTEPAGGGAEGAVGLGGAPGGGGTGGLAAGGGAGGLLMAGGVGGAATFLEPSIVEPVPVEGTGGNLGTAPAGEGEGNGGFAAGAAEGGAGGVAGFGGVAGEGAWALRRRLGGRLMRTVSFLCPGEAGMPEPSPPAGGD